MENASKALIIAGGVLLGIMILGIGVLLFKNANLLSESYNQKLTHDDIVAFNNDFLIYDKKINAQEMVSLINLINENNIKNIGIPEKQIKLQIDTEIIDVHNVSEEWKINIMKDTNINKDGKYECVLIDYNSETGYVNFLKFKTI